MNIAAYCRVSTDKEDQLNSLETQKKFFEEYAQKNHHTLVKIYADEGISGTKIKNRVEFQRLLRDARHGLFEMIVVKDISRFARNTVDLLNSTRELKALGIETTFLTANMTVLGQSEFVLTIFGALAQEESANTSKRVKFGKNLNAKKGRVPNIVYGYDKTAGDYFNLAINAQEADIIRQIYQWYISEGYGAAKMAQMLNDRGIKTKRGYNWSQNAICRILTNELYTGKIINGKEEVEDFLTGKRKEKDESEWIVTDRPDLRIIEPEIFDKAQAILQNRHDAFNLKHERQSNKHLFSTLIKCKDCGYSFRRVERKYKNTFVRWVCSGRNAKGTGACDNKTTVDEQELIDSLQDYFTALLADKPRITKNLISNFTRTYKSRNDNEYFEKDLKQKLDKLQKQKQKYMDMYQDDLITRDELRAKVSIINADIEKSQNELKLIEYNLDKGDQLETLLAHTFSTVEDVVSMDTITNAQLKEVIDRIEVDHEGNVDIYLKLMGDLGLDQGMMLTDAKAEEPVTFTPIRKAPSKYDNADSDETLVFTPIRKENKSFHLTPTIHKDVTDRLTEINAGLAQEVKTVLDKNKSERHIRGGLATQLKYKSQH